MQFLTYIIFRLALGLFKIMPFRLLYALSDVLSWLFYHLIQYRKKVILTNLKRAFPGKKDQEIRLIARKTYTNLTDILLESLKGFSVREEKLIKRYKILNPEFLDRYFEKNQSIIGVTGHYANWEWGALAGSAQMKHKPIAFYKPLSNSYIDQYIKSSRAESGTLLYSIRQTSETFSKHKHENCIFLMVADQSPSDSKKAYWIDFLNQDTACLHGPEKHARINNYPVIYLDIQRIKRGYYTVQFSQLIENPAEETDGLITEKYMRQLEQIIREKPENWMWSHKRWKKKRNPKKE